MANLKRICIIVTAAGAVIAVAVVTPILVIQHQHASSSNKTSTNSGQSTYQPNSGSTGGTAGGNSGGTTGGSTTTPSSHTGDMTFYAPGLGACGLTSTPSDNICAISHALYDASNNSPNPNTNPLCGRTLRATHLDSVSGTQKSLVLTVVDRCEGCAEWDIDLSPGAFGRLEGDSGKGRVRVGWEWV